ncbi:hypothetical protein LHGZ1_1079 [Laribacter hongkongensis]|uniref:Uncharacterized protein n=1 Tax=Laribacter hongkongensis TaxID=168471 RepID=A0A248LGK9_9NEIS|nr:hypothetical protein LHGZ1_1079 [Laribacter hongkongensis]
MSVRFAVAATALHAPFCQLRRFLFRLFFRYVAALPGFAVRARNLRQRLPCLLEGTSWPDWQQGMCYRSPAGRMVLPCQGLSAVHAGRTRQAWT